MKWGGWDEAINKVREHFFLFNNRPLALVHGVEHPLMYCTVNQGSQIRRILIQLGLSA
jgi:hypothetical protein